MTSQTPTAWHQEAFRMDRLRSFWHRAATRTGHSSLGQSVRASWLVLASWLALALAGCAESDPSHAVADTSATQDISSDISTSQDLVDIGTGGKPLQPVITEVAPTEGDSGGLYPVTIRGQFLGAAVGVSFGGSQALDVQVLSDAELLVTAPPRPPGVVDVVVLSNGRPEATAKDAFRYRSAVALHAVSPKSGPSSGGTQVTLTGAGFDAQTQFAFGTRLVAQAVVVDDQTAIVTTPPGSGQVDVVVANPSGQAQQKRGFSYQTVPQLQGLQPPVAAMAGGSVIELSGEGLQASGSGVAIRLGETQQLVQVQSVSADGKRLRFVAPAQGLAGPWDVIYASPQGSATLPAALAYASEESGLAVASLVPNRLAVNQLRAIDAGVTGKWSASQLGQLQLWFGEQEGAIQARKPVAGLPAAALRVVPPLPPTGVPLPYTVQVTASIGSAKSPIGQSFTWQAAQPIVEAVQPSTLPAAQGGQLLLTLAGLLPSHAVQQVRIAGQVATGLQTLSGAGTDKQVVRVFAPSGAPGTAPIEVRLATGESALLAEGFGYVADKPFVAALTPATGAQAGGTWTWLIGGGMGGLKSVWIGKEKAQILHIASDGQALIATPPGQPGWAPVTAFFANEVKAQLAKGFLYFDPSDVDLGTWGEPLQGCVNVHVVNKNKSKPIPGATVTIGDNPPAALQGKTDANGQLTLCCLPPVCCVESSCTSGLTGPVDVHASKTGFSAGSMVSVAVENVTIRLQEFPPPPDGNGSGGGNQDPVPPNATLQGKVLGAPKYLQLPPGDCATTAANGENCKPCQSDADCTQGGTCQVMSSPTTTQLFASATEPSTVRYCASACIQASDCPAGFECRAVGTDLASAKFRCAPRIGTPQTRCESASPSIFGGALPAGEGGIAKDDGSFAIPATPGDTAVVCRAGYVDAKSGQFVPLAMGLVTKIFVLPGQIKSDIAVAVNIALNRRLRVLLDRIPMGPDAKGLRQLTAGLDLGPDGYVPLGQANTFAQTDTLEFIRQPDFSALTEQLGDVTYALYGGLSNQWGGSPNSTSQAYGIDPRGFDHYAVLAPGSDAAVESSGAMGSVYAGDARGDLSVAVGEAGRIWYWTGGGFTQQASPTTADLRAVWIGPGGSGWIGGDNGTLLRRAPLGWQAVAAPDLRSVRGLAGVGPNEAWALLADNQLWRWDGAVWSAVSGPIASVSPNTGGTEASPGQPVAPVRLRAIWQSPTGRLHVAGDNGLWLWTDPAMPDAQGKLVWTTVQTGTWRTIHGLHGSSDTDIFAVGDRGLWLHWNTNGLQTLPANTMRSLRVVRAIGSAVYAAGSQGTWLRWTDSGAGSGHVDDLSLPLLRVDLQALLPTLDGGAAAAGVPGLVMGPYLEMPWIELPAYGATQLGNVVRWGAHPGVVPSFNIVRLADASYTTRWEMFVRGGVTEVALPNFAALGESNPLPGGPTYVRVWRVYAPAQVIDDFSARNLSTAAWQSWSYNVSNLTEPPLFEGVGTAGAGGGKLPGQLPGQQTPLPPAPDAAPPFGQPPF